MNRKVSKSSKAKYLRLMIGKQNFKSKATLTEQ